MMHYAPLADKCLLHHHSGYPNVMINEAAGRRLKEARKQFFPTMRAAAQALEQPYATYRQHESGERGFKADVERYARRFRTTPEWLLFGRQNGEKAPTEELRRIPIINWISAGQLTETGHEIHPDDDEWALLSGLPNGRYFATRVRGDSMDRFSPEGSVIVVNVEDVEPKAGRAYVFRVKGETTYKIFQDEPVTRLEPYSTNPMNRTIFPKLQDLVVIGRVVRSFVDLP